MQALELGIRQEQELVFDFDHDHLVETSQQLLLMEAE